jgi:hypothetical protein
MAPPRFKLDFYLDSVLRYGDAAALKALKVGDELFLQLPEIATSQTPPPSTIEALKLENGEAQPLTSAEATNSTALGVPGGTAEEGTTEGADVRAATIDTTAEAKDVAPEGDGASNASAAPDVAMEDVVTTSGNLPPTKAPSPLSKSTSAVVTVVTAGHTPLGTLPPSCKLPPPALASLARLKVRSIKRPAPAPQPQEGLGGAGSRGAEEIRAEPIKVLVRLEVPAEDDEGEGQACHQRLACSAAVFVFSIFFSLARFRGCNLPSGSDIYCCASEWWRQRGRVSAEQDAA